MDKRVLVVDDDRLIREMTRDALVQEGVRVATALPLGNLLLQPLRGRIDLRNHRKIVVIDNSITYCGSQNCADPEFRIKAKYAPWVDAMMRFEGPVARQNQHLFVSDWMAQTDEDLTYLLRQPLPPGELGLTAGDCGLRGDVVLLERQAVADDQRQPIAAHDGGFAHAVAFNQGSVGS